MEELINSILNVIQDWAPVIYAAATVGIGMFFKFRDIAIKKKKEIDAQNEAKNKENYLTWKHEESSRVITKIKDLCNFFKDRGKMDSVSYIQLENGTVAASKLCNMFVTCLAEDDRYSVIPKKIRKLQRVPYSQLSEWVEEVTTHECIIPDVQAEELHVEEPFFEDVGSHLSETVHDKDGYLIGMVVFNYFSRYFNEADEEKQIDFLRQFQASIESVFISYHVARMDMKKQLHLDENEISENNNGG